MFMQENQADKEHLKDSARKVMMIGQPGKTGVKPALGVSNSLQ